MHANERGPRGTDISLQTCMHIEREGERMKEEGKIQRQRDKTETRK